METITWNEYKARSTSKNDFRLTHYSPLFNNAFCMVNIEQNIGTVTHKLGWDTRYFEKEWNNQVNQVADRHMLEYVEITVEVVEMIKNKLEGYKKALNKALEWLTTGLSGYDYNQAIHDKTFNSMMIEKYEMILSLCPSFENDPQDEKAGEIMKALNININVVSFDGLSKEAKKIARSNIQDFLYSILDSYIKEIEESKDAYLKAYHSGELFHLNKDECPLTGVCYDYDFMSIDHINSESVENEVNKVFMKLKRDEKIIIFSDEYASELCDANDIYFLENGAEYNEMKKLLIGLV